jgi:hypothetical protein
MANKGRIRLSYYTSIGLVAPPAYLIDFPRADLSPQNSTPGECDDGRGLVGQLVQQLQIHFSGIIFTPFHLTVWRAYRMEV